VKCLRVFGVAQAASRPGMPRGRAAGPGGAVMDVGALMPMLLQAQNDPFLASNLGLPGVQVGECGPMFIGPGPQTAAQPVYDPGGA